MRRVDGVVRGAVMATALASATTLFGVANVPTAKAEPECLTGSYDFNRDGNADYASGLPGAADGAGAVEVALSVDDLHDAVERVQPSGLRPGDKFGAAVGEVAYYQDEGEDARCSQLVVGAPGRDVDGKKDAGSIFLFAFEGGEFTLVKEFVQGKDGVGGQARAGARFGAALAAPSHSDDIGPVVTPLYAGAPGGGSAGAGEVVRLEFGGAEPTAVKSTLIGQGSGTPGTAEQGDDFGASLATVLGGAIIGVPGENAGAGGVVHWNAAKPSNSRFVTQNTAGVPGTGEVGDRFGQVVVATPALDDESSPYVLVGAPGEAIGSLKAAGAVVAFHHTLSLQDVRGYNQDTPGIAGTAEAGDGFGSSVATFGTKLVAGVPGEDVGSVTDAGMLNSLSDGSSWTQAASCAPKETVEAGDRFGASLANVSVPVAGGDPPGWWTAPLVGVPGENDGAGLVHYGVVGDGPACESWTSSAAQPGDHLGASVGKVN